MLTRSTALLATCALLLLGGCSDDGGSVEAADTTTPPGDETTTTDGGNGGDGADEGGEGDGDAQEFCDFVLAQEDLDIDEEPEAVAAAMEDMRDLAPDALTGEVEVLLAMVEKMATIDEDDPEAFGELMAIAMDPAVEAAVSAIDEFGVEECGLEEGELMGTDESGSFGDDGMEDDDETGAADNAMSIDALQSFIEETYGDESWADDLSSWTIMGGTEVQVGPFEEDLTADEALAACEALAEHVIALEPDASIEILDAAGEAVARWSSNSEACTAVL